MFIKSSRLFHVVFAISIICTQNILQTTHNFNVFILPGLVTTLHGLNIANNPLEFPPESVVEGGTKSILAFFRDLLRAKNEAGYGGPGDCFSKKAY